MTDFARLVKPPRYIENKYGDASSWMADTLHGRFTYGVDFAGKFYTQTPDGEQDHDTMQGAQDFVHAAYAARVLAALDTEAVKGLVEAGSWLSVCAQTTGGTAGRDNDLVAAIEGWTAALARLKGVQP